MSRSAKLNIVLACVLAAMVGGIVAALAIPRATVAAVSPASAPAAPSADPAPSSALDTETAASVDTYTPAPAATSLPAPVYTPPNMAAVTQPAMTAASPPPATGRPNPYPLPTPVSVPPQPPLTPTCPANKGGVVMTLTSVQRKFNVGGQPWDYYDLVMTVRNNEPLPIRTENGVYKILASYGSEKDDAGSYMGGDLIQPNGTATHEVYNLSAYPKVQSGQLQSFQFDTQRVPTVASEDYSCDFHVTFGPALSVR